MQLYLEGMSTIFIIEDHTHKYLYRKKEKLIFFFVEKYFLLKKVEIFGGTIRNLCRPHVACGPQFAYDWIRSIYDLEKYMNICA